VTLFEPTRFEPTLQAAHARLHAVNPAAYARTRNALDGAVTRLSPYLTHGLLSLREVYDAVNARHPMDAKHKFVFELGWRAYWRHVWEHVGDGINQSTHQGLLPEHAYQPDMPADVLEARTGIPAIDHAVRELYTTGYLHNHARMWLASYLVHMRKVHWHAGAQWMLGHLLDGDVASNHLSWQWVAGTGSSKPYLFNADNVAKYAPAHWHSPGTAIDSSYEALDDIARHAAAIDTRFDQRRAGEGIAQPLLSSSPLVGYTSRVFADGDPKNHAGAAVAGAWQSPCATNVDHTGRDIWFHHPWSLGAWAPVCSAQVKEETAKRAGDTEQNALHIAIGFDTSHASTPWTEQRWDFVTRGLQAHTQHLWWGSAAQIAAALQGAKSVQWHANPHADPALAQLREHLSQSAPKVSVSSHVTPCLFEPVQSHCRSFSDWWKRTRIA
jgi:deoxyribodipyrimidine photo-lyase